MYKKLVATGIFFIGTILTPRINAASFSHRFVYTNTDNALNATLVGEITFDDSVLAAQNNTSGSSTAIDRSFIINNL